jgi:hypothetical protein
VDVFPATVNDFLNADPEGVMNFLAQAAGQKSTSIVGIINLLIQKKFENDALTKQLSDLSMRKEQLVLLNEQLERAAAANNVHAPAAPSAPVPMDFVSSTIPPTVSISLTSGPMSHAGPSSTASTVVMPSAQTSSSNMPQQQHPLPMGRAPSFALGPPSPNIHASNIRRELHNNHNSSIDNNQ